jgi:hypothetical protein
VTEKQYMNPKYAKLMDEGAARDREQKAAEPGSDVAGGRHVRKEKFLKSEVGYEHPAKGADHCAGCVNFRRPHDCEVVAGFIRREDWCKRFEEKK